MTQRTSEEVMRAEFEKITAGDRQWDGDHYRNPFTQAVWEGFQLGQKSLAGKVPVEAIETAVSVMRSEFPASMKAQYFEIESFLATIRSLQ